MESILERYERYSYAERQLVATDSESQGSWSLEHPNLMAKIEVLQRNIRHYVGEDLESLSLRELQSLEQQIDTTLKRIRTRKNQLMHESISELHKKEKALQEQNNLLAKKLKNNEKTLADHAQGEQQTLAQNFSLFVLQQPPPLSLPCLTIGGIFQAGRSASEDDGAPPHPSPHPLMPPWMLRHVNQWRWPPRSPLIMQQIKDSTPNSLVPSSDIEDVVTWTPKSNGVFNSLSSWHHIRSPLPKLEGLFNSYWFPDICRKFADTPRSWPNQNLDNAIASSKNQYDFEIRWHPYFLNPSAPKEGIDKKEFYTNKFGSRAEQIMAQMTQVFKGLGLEYNISGLTGNTLDSHRIIYFSGQQGSDKQHNLVEELCLGYFTQAKYIGDREFLVESAKKVGVEGAAEFLDNPNNGLKEVNEELEKYSAHINGVPFYVLNGKHQISGGQPPEVFLRAFQVAANDSA
ncbi:hypothetical protein F0562_005182 [Nyssa sinensis]|uniref:K-box domain-containing protein n=1 Tax=Nyssa sinensis TaxID=561372 RepID=A0A5J5AHG7_9ASTE|nr:hypothetical protein F0562_005182 [Nyssa sinensis]